MSCIDERKLPKEVTIETGMDFWKETLPIKINMVTVAGFPYIVV